MPSTVTHAYFIMDIYDKLPVNRKIFLKNQENILKTSAQSMDPLNFYFSFNLKKGKKIRKFAEYFHKNKTEEYLITLINYIKYNYYSSDAEVMAFLYGMVSHYVLDSNMHPFVCYKTGVMDKTKKETYKYNSKHHIMETYFDKYLIKIKDNKLPHKYKHYKEILMVPSFSKNLKDVIDFSFKETFKVNNFNKILTSSMKTMKLSFKLLRYDPIGIKYSIYKIIDKVTTSKTPKIEFLSYYYKNNNRGFLNEERKIWYNPANKKIKHKMSFNDLYIDCFYKTIEMIKAIDEYIYKNKKIDLHEVFNNKSYATGLELNKKQDMKYFEY